MTGSERDVLVEGRAYRILNDSRAFAAHAKYIEAQLRYRTIRGLLTRLRAFARLIVMAFAAMGCAGIFRAHSPSTLVAEKTAVRRQR